MRPDAASPVAPGALGYEVWQGGGATWVELRRDGEPAVLLDAPTLTALELLLDDHLAAPEVRSASVGVRDGDVRVALQQDWPVGAVGVVLAIVAVLVGAAVVVVRTQRRAARSVALARREVEAREIERTRVAREIHDGPLQGLALMARTADADPERVRAQLREVGADLRALAADLRPPALDRLGLGPALEDLADRWARAPTPLAVRVDAPRASALGLDEEVALYRIAQEALTNASRHGRARTAWVFVRVGDAAVEMVARDDGVGLPPSVVVGGGGLRRLLAEGHFGLVGMVERAQTIGASLAVSRGPGGVGTEVRVRVPTRKRRNMGRRTLKTMDVAGGPVASGKGAVTEPSSATGDGPLAAGLLDPTVRSQKQHDS